MTAPRNVETMQEALYNDWRLTPIERPDKLEWPTELGSHEKARWGFQIARRALVQQLPSVWLIDRSDFVSWPGGESMTTDLQVEWMGRTSLWAIHAYLPRQSFREWQKYGAQQGLDTPDYDALLEEQARTGLPIYVLWVSQTTTDARPQLAGRRLDALGRPQSEALNRRRTEKGARTYYWSLSALLTMPELGDDLESIPFLPQQLVLGDGF